MKKLLIYLSIFPFISSCSEIAPNILVACEENNVGNCVVKWETSPVMSGKVKVYASTDPDDIPEEMPIAMSDISNGFVTIVTDNPSMRYYFLMDFDGKYRYKVATRNLNISGVQNFRDLGGYRTNNGTKSVRWGMLYRSADIDNIDGSAVRELHNIGIKTIIDLRDKDEVKNNSRNWRGFKVIHLPIKEDDIDNFLHKIQERKVICDTVARLVEQSNRNMINDNQVTYHKIFNILLDRRNYPIVIHCSSGEGRTGIVSALILSALDVSDDDIMDDYCLSNKYFNIARFSKFAYDLPDEYQEAITTIFSAKNDFLNAAFEQMERLYGDSDAYLEKGVGLNKSSIKKLRSLLLRDN
jgi:protein-tyrosine phosphatase